jgi:hypothetical protein
VVPEGRLPTRETAARPPIVITVVSVALAAALAACGGNKPAVCSSSDSLDQSVQSVKAIPQYTASSPSDVERELPAIESDLAQVKADAKSEFSSQIDAVESSYASLRTSVEAAKTDPSPDTLRAAGTALSTFNTVVGSLISDIRSTC